jgi:hypothetical protein
MPEPSARDTPMTLSVTFFFESPAEVDAVAVATEVTAVVMALRVAERVSVADILMGWVYCLIPSQPRRKDGVLRLLGISG